MQVAGTAQQHNCLKTHHKLHDFVVCVWLHEGQEKWRDTANSDVHKGECAQRVTASVRLTETHWSHQRNPIPVGQRCVRWSRGVMTVSGKWSTYWTKDVICPKWQYLCNTRCKGNVQEISQLSSTPLRVLLTSNMQVRGMERMTL